MKVAACRDRIVGSVWAAGLERPLASEECHTAIRTLRAILEGWDLRRRLTWRYSRFHGSRDRDKQSMRRSSSPIASPVRRARSGIRRPHRLGAPERHEALPLMTFRRPKPVIRIGTALKPVVRVAPSSSSSGAQLPLFARSSKTASRTSYGVCSSRFRPVASRRTTCFACVESDGSRSDLGWRSARDCAMIET
jgi:hypothetical protein